MDCQYLEPGSVSRSVLRCAFSSSASPRIGRLPFCCYRKPVGDGSDELTLLQLAGLFAVARP